jgi:hypothetical protein
VHLRRWEPVERPSARAHPAFGLRAVSAREPLLSLTESSLPDWWNDLDDSDGWDLKHLYFEHLFDQMLSGRSLHFEVHLSDPRQLAAALAEGAQPGSLPLSASGDLTRGRWTTLIDTDPTDLTVYDEKGARLLSVLDNWDGVFLYGGLPIVDSFTETGFTEMAQ